GRACASTRRASCGPGSSGRSGRCAGRCWSVWCRLLRATIAWWRPRCCETAPRSRCVRCGSRSPSPRPSAADRITRRWPALWSPLTGSGSPGAGEPVRSSHHLTVPGIQATGPAAGVEMLEQRDRDAAAGAERLACLGGGEGLREPGQLPHGEGGGGGQQDHLARQAQHPAEPGGGGELFGAQAERGEVVRGGGGEGLLPQMLLEGGDRGLGRAELRGAEGVQDPSVPL